MSSNYQYIHNSSLECSDLDLLSLMIGGEEAERKAKQLLRYFNGLSGLAQSSPAALARYPGIGTKTAIRIHAGIRMGRRSLFSTLSNPYIRTAEMAFQVLWPHLSKQAEESLYALYLNRRKKLIRMEHLTQGSEAFTIVDPRQIFHHALLCRSSGIILAHNHPSGDPTPSGQDIDITQRVFEVGEILQIPLLDHLVIGDESYVSLKALGFVCS